MDAGRGAETEEQEFLPVKHEVCPSTHTSRTNRCCLFHTSQHDTRRKVQHYNGPHEGELRCQGRQSDKRRGQCSSWIGILLVSQSLDNWSEPIFWSTSTFYLTPCGDLQLLFRRMESRCKGHDPFRRPCLDFLPQPMWLSSVSKRSWHYNGHVY